MEKSQNYILEMCWQQTFPLHWAHWWANLMSLGHWPWCLDARQRDDFSPLTAYIPKRNCDLLVLGFWEASLIFWKWGHITRRTIYCTRKGADKCCTQIISHSVCASWWWETSHSRKMQLGQDGFDDHRYPAKPLPSMSNGNYDLVGSLFPCRLFAFSHPSRSSQEVSQHCVCLEGAAPAHWVGTHTAQSLHLRVLKEGTGKAKEDGLWELCKIFM